jgi:hypothetical protein
MSAIGAAESRDVIELALGRYKLVGRDIQLPSGVTIMAEMGLSGGVIIEEYPCFPGDWRDHPVFVVDGRCLPVVFRGITFRDFNLSCGPYQGVGNPIFAVNGGTIEFDRCRFENHFKTAIWFDGGIGRFVDCEFASGRGLASAIHFAGSELTMDNCVFRNSSWLQDCGELVGSVLRLMSGTITMNDCRFLDNGPLIHLVTIAPEAELNACTSCLCGQLTMWEGLVAGRAVLDCCNITPTLWYVPEGGELVIIDPAPGAKSMTYESTSWTDLKQLFE